LRDRGAVGSLEIGKLFLFYRFGQGNVNATGGAKNGMIAITEEHAMGYGTHA